MKIELEISDAIALKALRQSVERNIAIDLFLQQLIEQSLQSDDQDTAALLDTSDYIDQFVATAIPFAV